jgi:hypothetical protein
LRIKYCIFETFNLALLFYDVLVSFGVLVICRLLSEKCGFKVKIATHSVNVGASNTSVTISSKLGSSDDSHQTSSTKKAVSRFVELILKRSWCHWKDNSKIYKVIFRKSWLILNVVHSSAHIVRSSALMPIKSGKCMLECN